MKDMRLPGLVYWGSIVLAFVLTLMPLPDALRVAKPFWLAIVVIYWALEAPERMGLGRAFLLGMAYGLWTVSFSGRIANGSVLLLMFSAIVFLVGLVSEQIAALRFEGRA